MKDEDALPYRSHKDTRRWCKGKIGVEHVPAVEHRTTYGVLRLCGWRVWGVQPGKQWRYSCYHATVCTTCGKVLHHLDVRSCPDTTPMPTGPPRYVGAEGQTHGS